MRTNFFQIDEQGSAKPTISIKFESRKLDELPAPRPLFEIFVYSPRVEGVHLRFGKVARGGIRWSDRPQDFRTEVLGLVKAQQVKNAVIVPVGAKGGFVPKRLVAGVPREAIQAEGVATYKLLVSSLLDITDNLGPDGVIPPPDVVRHDADDPYLVVAADKGTATFSDIANGISAEHGSGSATPSRPAARPATTTRAWASPRAAPGRRCGGISARWTSTSRRRRSRSRASATCRATCSATACCASARSGSSRRSTIATSSSIRIPIRETSFDERKRLFALPRSSWQDYDKALISAAAACSRARPRRSRCPSGAEATRACQGQGDAAGGDARDPAA